MKNRNFVPLILLASIMSLTANAQQKPINISSQANATWCGEIQNLIGCSSFPTGTQSYDGVKFQIPTSNNAWFADQAAGGGSGTVSVTIPVNVAKVKTVYTLMNTIWGSSTPGLASITFTATGGVSWTYTFVEGTDLRDYNNGPYINTIACDLPTGTGKTGTVQAFFNGGGPRLDMQIFELPSTFAIQTLLNVTITDNGAPSVQRSFIAAMTVSTAKP